MFEKSVVRVEISCLSDVCPSFRWRHLVNAYKGLPDRIVSSSAPYAFGCLVLSPVLNLVVATVLRDSIGTKYIIVVLRDRLL